MIVEKKRKKVKGSGHKSVIADVSLTELMSIISKYNRKHKTSYTYGQFVSLESMGKIKL